MAMLLLIGTSVQTFLLLTLIFSYIEICMKITLHESGMKSRAWIILSYVTYYAVTKISFLLLHVVFLSLTSICLTLSSFNPFFHHLTHITHTHRAFYVKLLSAKDSDSIRMSRKCIQMQKLLLKV
jgi:hypothetical protein